MLNGCELVFFILDKVEEKLLRSPKEGESELLIKEEMTLETA